MADAVAMFELARRIDRERADAQRQRLDDALRCDALGRAAAILLATAYPATASLFEAHPEAATELDRATLQPLAERLSALRSKLDGLADPAEVRRSLRRAARDERLRVALRELLPAALGGADVDETARELSDLADATIDMALAEAKQQVFACHGTPHGPDDRPSQLVVLGMGKLGGQELNAGSDVDLVCFYDSDDGGARSPDGVRRSCHEIWTKVVQRMTSTLQDVTEDGFVWRVDLRLRPEGTTGPLVNSLAAAERYYEAFGRVWERAALLRARPVAGDRELGSTLLRLLEPFVWTRRVDPAVAEIMVELARRARAKLTGAPDQDLKLRAGGIREAEFFVQALQLIWGGQERRLRARPTLEALARLRAAGRVTEREQRDVEAAYLALRRAEHGVQFATGQQTHRLPRHEAELARLARALGYDHATAFTEELAGHSARVHDLLRSLVPTGEAPVSRWLEALQALDTQDAERFARALTRARLVPASLATESPLVRALWDQARHPDAPLGVRSREQYRHLAEGLLDAIADAADPEQAAHYLRRFYSRLRHASIYTRHLASDLAAVRRLATVLGASAFVGEAVVTQPELGDLVSFGSEPPSPAEARAEIRRASRQPLAEDDSAVEQQAGLLRRAKNRVITQVALADLAGELEPRAVAHTLSALADASLEAASHFALGVEADEPLRGLSIIAMGKLGGREMGYGSDLDVIFLYDPTGAPEDPLAYFSRRARRIIQLVSLPHAEGPGYELDARLRPSGSQGLLVVSLEALARYHDVPLGLAGPPPSSRSDAARPVAPSARAATWERLPLLKARFAAGDPELGRDAMQLLHAAAYGREIDVTAAARDVHRLRRRMERELARERPGRYDLKFGRGGLMDIEFCVQLLQLQHGSDERVRTTDTADAIAALAKAGGLSARHAAWLRDGHAFLRLLEQRIRVVHADSSHLIEADAAGLGPLARRMGMRSRAQVDAATALLQRYRDATDRIRQCYDEIVVQAAGVDAAAEEPLT